MFVASALRGKRTLGDSLSRPVTLRFIGFVKAIIEAGVLSTESER